ncbi:MAG: NRDE family protein [Desulfuromonadales bacterium]|nr:MAG: NRDE family protein [Desulfuromonadales bacterium]
MCLIVVALDCHPTYKLIVAANRDEYFNRPTAPAGLWDDAPQVLAGRDLQAGGTWLGVTTTGRLAAVTNYRDPTFQPPNPRSRGQLVADFLTGMTTPAEYLETLRRDGAGYGGFNLLFGDRGRLFYFSNRGGVSGPVPPGIHGLSNHLLDTPWPKVQAAKDRLECLLDRNPPDTEALFEALGDPHPFPDHLLPDTGVGIERERLLSPLFIEGTDYGTRSSTLVLIDRKNTLTFLERSYDSQHGVNGNAAFSIVSGGIVSIGGDVP